MVEIVDNQWRPFVVLTCLEEIEDGKTIEHPFYFDVNCRCVIIKDTQRNATLLNIKDIGSYLIKETPEEILAAADDMINKQVEKLAKQAEENYKATMESVAKTAKKVEGK